MQRYYEHPPTPRQDWICKTIIDHWSQPLGLCLIQTRLDSMAIEACENAAMSMLTTSPGCRLGFVAKYQADADLSRQRMCHTLVTLGFFMRKTRARLTVLGGENDNVSNLFFSQHAVVEPLGQTLIVVVCPAGTQLHQLDHRLFTTRARVVFISPDDFIGDSVPHDCFTEPSQ
jgi:hypothetical protein